MADEIRKVGIELTAQGAQEFTQSLKGIKAATNEAYSELKLAQSQYDKNTSAVDKLRDRQEYLQKVTEQYQKKSELLRGELAQLETAENRDETAIAKKRAELNQCNAKLNDYEKSLKDVNNQLSTHSAQLKEWGDKLKAVGDKTTEIGKGLTTHVTAPIVAAGAASVTAWKEVDEAMDTVTTKTGASGEALEDMQQRVKNIAETIPTDFQTAADAVGEVNTRFGITGDHLEDLSSKFVKFAQLNDTDVSSSIDTVQSAMAAWGLQAGEAGSVLNVLNKAGQDTGISVDKLSDMLKTNKTALDEAGMSFSDSAMFLANLDKNGVDAGTALAGLKKALQNATKEGKPASEALHDLQQKMSDGSNKTAAYAAATELFGAKAGPAIADACMSGRLSFEELGTSMADFAGNVESTFSETVDPLDQLQMSMNTMKDLGSEIVESAAPLLVEAMTALRDVIVDLKEKWESMSPEQQEMILKIAGIVAAVGPLLVILGTVISTISTIGGAISGVIGIVGAPFLGPLLLVVAAIAAVIAIGVALYKNWDTIKANAKKFVSDILEKWDNFKRDTISKFIAIKDGVKEKIDAMKESIDEKFGGIADKAQDIFEKVRGFIEDPIGTAKDFVKNAIEDIKGFFNFDWSLPDIKLPHFHVDWTDLGFGVSLPSISVQWFRKAYENPYMFTSPTAVGGYGFGDGAGGEMVYGHSALMQDIQMAMGSGELQKTMQDIRDMLTDYLPVMAEAKIVLDSGKLVGAMTSDLDANMGVLAARRKRSN